ncbi:hypothetical protein NIES4101_43300 [Calothrix sp. NIES-4101]|nr:hypothetical protein NIES4101_43300 [Calothrix sp. NIES-4101]
MLYRLHLWQRQVDREISCTSLSFIQKKLKAG